jgi:hypothetical protein
MVTCEQLPLVISIAAFISSILAFVLSRSSRLARHYWDRWAAISQTIIAKPNLARIWAPPKYMKQHFPYDETAAAQWQPTPEEIAFAEFYLNFFAEVCGRNPVVRILLGPYPGWVPLRNPWVRKIYRDYLQETYKPCVAKRMDREATRCE